MQTPYKTILKACISLTTARILKRFSLNSFGMNEKPFQLKNNFSKFFGEKRVFDQTIKKQSGISQNLHSIPW